MDVFMGKTLDAGRIGLELEDESKLLEKLLRKGDLEKAESKAFTIYQSLKNRNGSHGV